MICKNFRTEIEASDGAQPLGARASAHVAACRACRELQAGHESLRRLVGGLERVEAPADFEFKLRARIARADGASNAGFVRRAFVPGAVWLAVAACAVLVLGMFIHFRPADTNAPPSPTNETVASTSGATTAPPSQTISTPAGEVSQLKAESSKESVQDVRVASRTQRNVARRGRFILPRDAVAQMASIEPGEGSLETNNLSVQGTKIYVGSPIPLPLTTPDRPLEAMFKDAHGASRVVSVDPVTFGARSLPSRRVGVKDVAYSQGVW
ncbi:MAG: hypothetical protein ACJ741_00955 [Pyrinomonadaceae bacterium]